MAGYDIVIIGSGPGGYVSAIRAAQLGAKVAVVESGELGGTCLNRGCIPTKALIRSGRVAALARGMEKLGVNVGEVGIDYGVMAARKDKVVGTLRRGVAALLKGNGVELVEGRGRISGSGEVEVETAGGERSKLSAKTIVIATGSEPARPGIFKFDGERVLTSQEAVGRTSLGKSVIIVGGGYIGCEYASLYANLGVEVTVLELLDDILAVMDADVIKEVGRGLKRRKVKVRTGVRVERLAADGEGAKAVLEGGEEVRADFAMVAVGRRPVTEGLGLSELGVAMERGYVVIDESCRTNVEGVMAIGDVTGKLQLAHVASEQGIVAAECAMGKASKMDYSVVPACVFTDSEAATVGMTEAQAVESGAAYKVGRFAFRGLGKAQAEGEIDGVVKVIGEEGTGRILGVHIVGAGASELIAEAALAMKAGLTAGEVAGTIHAHPTLPEAVKEAMEAFAGRAIHSL